MKYKKLYYFLTILLVFCIPIEPFLAGMYNYFRIFYIILFLIIFMSQKHKSTKIKKYDAFMLLFVLFSFLSIFYTIHTQSSTSMARELVINVFLSIAISYNITINEDKNRILNALLYSFICGTILMSLYLLVIELPQLGRWGRLGYNLFENYGSFMVYSYSCIISSCYLLWDLLLNEEKNKKRKINYLIKIMFLLIICIGIIASGTRKAILCPIIFIMFGYYLKYKKKFLKLFISFIIIFMLLFFGYKIIMNNETFYNRIGVRIDSMVNSIFNNSKSDGSLNERDLLRKLSIQAWLESPVIGNGLHAFRYYSLMHNGPYLYSHCNYTELLADLGLIGFLCYYAAYLYLLFQCIKKSKNTCFYTFFLSFLLMNLISDYSTISYYRHYYLIVYFIISRYISKCETEQKNESKKVL